MIVLTGIQHTTSGEIAIPAYTQDEKNVSYIEDKYLAERTAYKASEAMLGLTLVTFDNKGSVMGEYSGNWVKQVQAQPEENEG